MSHGGDAVSRTAKRRHERADAAQIAVGQPVEIAVTSTTHRLDLVCGQDRRENCQHYRGCLSYAVRKGWDDFACGSCSDFVPSDDAKDAALGIQASIANARRSEL